MPRLAVLGQPISHSRSPAMHSAALAELGLAGEWTYEAIEVAPEDLAPLIGSMPGEGFVGANVTVPHKLAALALAETASEPARAIGAANTLSFAEAGVAADNTDASGLLEALPGPADGMRALVLGAGGSARAAIWALKQAGAAVAIWNRTAARADALAGEFGAEVAELDTANHQLPAANYDLLVNCTTVGLAEANGEAVATPGLKALPLDADSISERQIVVDLVYGPSATPLATLARSRGAQVVDGLDVLVHQGAASLRLWTGLEAPVETMRRAARDQRN